MYAKKIIYDWIVYIKVIEMESFSSAATELHIKVSTVSKIIAKLEDVFGYQLITRNAHRFQVTEVGKIVYEKALVICETYYNLIARLESGKSSIHGTMRLSTPGIICNDIATHWIIDYMDFYPNAKIHILSRDSGNLNIEPPEFDDLVINSGFIDSPDLIHKRINSVPFCICAAPSYLKKYGTPSEPVELKNHRVLRLSHPSLKSPLTMTKNNEIQQINIMPENELTSNNVATLLLMAREGCGINIASPYWYAENDIKKGNLIPLFNDWNFPDLPVNLIWRYRKNYSPLFLDFIKYIENKWNLFFQRKVK